MFEDELERHPVHDDDKLSRWENFLEYWEFIKKIW
jgi:hypothetical protein